LKFQNDRKESLKSQLAKSEEDFQEITSGIVLLKEEKQAEGVTLNVFTQELQTAKQLLENIRGDHSALRLRLEEQAEMMREAEKEVSETEKNITVNNVQRQNLLEEQKRSELEFENRRVEYDQLQNKLQQLRIETQ